MPRGVNGSFQATLCWDDPVSIIANAAANNTWQSTSTLARDPNGLIDLGLYLFKLNPDNTLGANVDYSTSVVDNVEHLYEFGLPAGNYALEVASANFNAPYNAPYGLAWSVTSVPEPSSLVLLAGGLLGGLGVTAARRRKARVA